jgi:hypothetical protein
METLIPETVFKIRPTDPLRLLSRAGSAKKLRLIRFRQFVGQGSCLTMSVEENQADEVIKQTARSVHH